MALPKIKKTDSEHYAFGYGDTEKLFKIIFWDDKEKSHLTILFNDYQRVIDIHKTFDNVPQSEKYKPILKIKYYTCMRFIALHSKYQVKLLKKYWLKHTITVGKLNRLNALIFPMNDPQNQGTFIDKKRKKKFRVKKEIDFDSFDNCFIYPELIKESKSDSFAVYTKKHRCIQKIGTIIKDNGRLYFITDTDFERFGNELIQNAIEVVTRLTFDSKNELLALLRQSVY